MQHLRPSFVLTTFLATLSKTSSIPTLPVSTVIETRITTTTISLPRSDVHSIAGFANTPRSLAQVYWRMDTNLPFIESSLASVAASTVATSVAQLKALEYCLTQTFCTNVLKLLEEAYQDLWGWRGMTDPSNQVENRAYQTLVCDPASGEIRDIDSTLTPCLSCAQQAFLPDSMISTLNIIFHTFCSEKEPSAYTFLSTLVSLISHDIQPKLSPSITVLHGGITGVTSLSTLLTSNDARPPSSPPSPSPYTTTGSDKVPPTKKPKSSPSPLPTQNSPIPSSLLTQVPSGWPYLYYGVARKPGQSATLTLTDEKKQPVALLVNSLAWWPRPLGKQMGMVFTS
ncbi:hypothetical protein BCR34DRAFT_633202 [Clohesyomyces aquaticus]|uniref:Uncharacterized protein n=1 Tax=Clohesyomyces aquaticus TaxID=1231657 RepID=A0A1Y1Z5C2_9PLEO|nr:hypothetical protein BCR34DRAFT_633202 [Clohesyomyces aquaticus]